MRRGRIIRVGLCALGTIVSCGEEIPLDEFAVEWPTEPIGAVVVENARGVSPRQRTEVTPHPIGHIGEDSGGDLVYAEDVARLSNGHIVIKSRGSLVVYDQNGRFIRRIERIGEGPGEWRTLVGFRVLGGDTLMLLARRPDRTIFLSRDGEFISQGALPDAYSNKAIPPSVRSGSDMAEFLSAVSDTASIWIPVAPLTSGDVLGRIAFHGLTAVGITRGADLYGILRRGDSLRVDTIGWFPGQIVRRVSPKEGNHFAGSPATSVAVGESYIYIGDGATYEIGQYDQGGRLLRRIRRDTERRRISSSDRRAFEEMLAGLIPDIQWLTHFPYYFELHTDERGRLWVQQPSDALHETQTWAVFESDGRWVEDVVMPFPSMNHRVLSIDTTSVMVLLPNTLSPEIEIYGLRERRN